MDQRMERLLRTARGAAYLAAGKAAEAAGAAERAAGQAASAVSSAGRAAAGAVSDLRTLRELERQEAALRRDIQLQLQAVGGMIYATHCGHPSDSEELLAKLRVIDGLEEQAGAIAARVETLRQKTGGSRG